MATGHAYPKESVENDDFFTRARYPVASEGARLVRSTRMRKRYWCGPEENTWTLARTAAERALETAPGLRSEIDVVLAVSSTTIPYLYPPEAHRPGNADLSALLIRDVLDREDCIGLDLKSCACAGFVRAVQVMDGLLHDPNHRAGLIVCAEQTSRLAVAESNRSTFGFILGDAAGAVVLRRTDRRDAEGTGHGLLDHTGQLAPAGLDLIRFGDDGRSLVMRGERAGEAIRHAMVSSARELLRRNDLAVGDVDWLLPIQAHLEIIQGLGDELRWPSEKVLWSGDVTGFSGSASIPAALSDYVGRGVVRRGDLILSPAAGAGINGGAALYRY
ncbi:3-oxoacyl-[acyl-carrier-protein] synthase III C-terminal domain-containing protein [Streptomyces lavendulae]|uniref:3-oxoacyl-[acyl-carrier-protein] synthase III C-terminal domain-containing protein n=1 Tax=Streptomyces lavendulae TaxID=1914 RepID=UPI0024A22246|nr:3-oxoacyl-[acyl-carrier-protein] synthase III C-terminal domain-containing protein [Streptomyces lavendulae]GLW04064.1 3-oxoacyl-[acyl-carrier-protein] synthase 3 [Streptomyces lavendulae subsp. lavendulae]